MRKNNSETMRAGLLVVANNFFLRLLRQRFSCSWKKENSLEIHVNCMREWALTFKENAHSPVYRCRCADCSA